MMKHSYWLVILICCFGCHNESDLPEVITLHDDWEFKKITETKWNPATVPGNVHSDLLENKLIEHPFIGNNEAELQWISETDWEYKTTFSVDEETLKKQHIELSFEGLDTYASIFLNDSLILKTNNAFREFQVNVKSILKAENELRIVLEHTSKYEEREKSKLGYTLPEDNRIFTRKAQFQYGWDWGPKLNTAGIWRPIKLSTWSELKIEDIYIKQLNLIDSLATLSAEININTDENTNLFVDIIINNSKIATHIIEVKSDKLKYSIPFGILNPIRWWPHNFGDPYLYDIKVVIKKGKVILDSISTKIGLRTIELVTEKDSIGESFYFKVNDVPVYAKGANYIPQNSMQNKVTNSHYEALLNDAVAANMNMLRVWGGGIYENDIFYDLCDEKGILVWQDFMFACAMYPGDEDYLENVKQEAIDNVKRLRNHASIALWCGNNENSEGWHRWGWKDGRSESEKDEIWNNYLKVFDSILPNIVSNLTDTDYWQSSPKYGRGNPKYEFEGDAHDWWVWHDAYPFEHLEEKVPRFMSEFGFQSFPSYEVINYINQSDSLEITSEEFKNHQKHVRGFQLIDEYMQRDFPVPTDAEDYVYMSQLLQAYVVTKGLEAQRRAKPYNMGTLFWQLNDCWPSVSWSSIDFFGNWKALHYKAKKAFDNILISSKIENNTIKTYIVNDNFGNIKGEFSNQIMDFEGNILWKNKGNIDLLPNSSGIKHFLNLDTLNINKNKVVFLSKFNNKSSFFYLTKSKDLKLQKSEITKTVSKTSSGFIIKLSSNTLQKDVFLYSKSKGHFSDNFFDLLPNETIEIEFETDIETFIDLKIKSLNDFVN